MHSVRNFFEKRLYIYITDFVFQNLSKFFGGGVNLTPPEISAGKVWNSPRMAQMDVKQVIWTNKTI